MSGNKSLSWMTSWRLQDGKGLLAGALVLGLLVRGAILTQTGNLGTPIIDEQHYTQIARNLLDGHGFGWGPNSPTSIRPPLYPAFVAAIWSVAGRDNYQAIRVVQFGLSAVTAFVVFLVGRQLFGARAGRVAAAVVWLYPSLIFFNVTVLTETVYSCLLVTFTLFSLRLVDSPRFGTAALAGLALGLTCLTRSSLWPLPFVLCPVMLVVLRGPVLRRATSAALLFIACALVLAPWAVRNTRLQGVVTIVDTMGGMNLRLGNFEHTPDDRMWDAVSMTGDRNWAAELATEQPNRRLTEGEKDQWALRRAVAFMIAHPETTMRRSAIRFADFWGLEREYAAGLSHGLYQAPPWLGLLISSVILVTFAGVAICGVAGLWLAPGRDWRKDVIVLIPPLAIMGAHLLTFGHSRYHVPVVPYLAIYGAALVTNGSRESLSRRWAVLGAIATISILLAVWIRQVLIADAARIHGFLSSGS